MNKSVLKAFTVLVFLSLLTPLWVFTELQFPYITSKAFFFRIVVELALPIYIYLVCVNKNLRPKLNNPLNIFVIAFFIINVVTAFLGVNPMRSLWGNFERMGGVYYLAHLVLLFFYIQLLGRAQGVYLKRFLQAFVAVAALVTLNGLSGWIHGPTFTTDLSLPDRVSSTFGNPIFFASYLIVPLFLAAYFFLSEEKRILKVLFAFAFVLQLVGIYSSGTRGAFVGLLAGVFVSSIIYFFLVNSTKMRRYGLLVFGTLLIIVGVLFAIHNKLPQGSTLSRMFNFNDKNTKARLIQWKMAIQGFKDRPIFGTGPENYYFVANKYYNPEIVQYDNSWFDKPHNFLLEILSTNGIFGLLAYISMIGLGIYGAWRAYKSELISLLEMCLLLAAIIAYQVQNLFVFDTVSASVAFYISLGFIVYIWSEGQRGEVEINFDTTEKFKETKVTLLAVGLLVIMFVVYFSNIQSMQAAKRVNFGYSYAEYNPMQAAGYFEQALKVKYNLDPRETANRYSDFASGIMSGDLVKTKSDFVAEQLNKATVYQRLITEKTKNDPILFLRLAIDELNLAQLNNQSINPSLAAADRAIELSPRRAEALQIKLQIVGSQKDWSAAVELGKQIAELNPYKSDLKWQLAMLYYLNNQETEAVKAGDEALASGFKFSSLQQFSWYIQYYEKQKDYTKTAPLLEKAIELEPNEIGLYVDLAQTYAKLGDYSHARALAQQVAVTDPSLKKQMEEFIKTLK